MISGGASLGLSKSTLSVFDLGTSFSFGRAAVVTVCRLAEDVEDSGAGGEGPSASVEAGGRGMLLMPPPESGSSGEEELYVCKRYYVYDRLYPLSYPISLLIFCTVKEVLEVLSCSFAALV